MHDEHQQKESQTNGCFLFDGVFPSLKLGSMQQTRISILDGSMVLLEFPHMSWLPLRPFLRLPIVGDDPWCSRDTTEGGRLSRRVAIFDAAEWLTKVTNRKQAEGTVWSQAIGSCWWAGTELHVHQDVVGFVYPHLYSISLWLQMQDDKYDFLYTQSRYNFSRSYMRGSPFTFWHNT